jgi:hypothetical protein
MVTYKTRTQRRRSYILSLLAATCIIQSAAASTVTSVTDKSSVWTALPNIYLDPNLDQQTGQGEADLVGVVSDPGFFIGWDGANVYYRVRIGAAAQTGPAFKSEVFWIGMDANNDGKLDLFLAVNNTGSTTNIGFWAPGASANTSPNTTSIAPENSAYQIAESASNFDYRFVTAAIDDLVGFSTSDLDADGHQDVYLSIAVPFFGASGSKTLQGAFAGLANLVINQNTPIRYVTATSTQTNSLNQDLGGIAGGVNSTTTWQDLGAFSNPATPAGAITPEPSTWILFGTSGAILIAASRIRSRRAAQRQ